MQGARFCTVNENEQIGKCVGKLYNDTNPNLTTDNVRDLYVTESLKACKCTCIYKQYNCHYLKIY